MSKHRSKCRKSDKRPRARPANAANFACLHSAAMFCSSCGSRMEIEFKYCPSRGKENKAVVPKAAVSSPSNNNNENNVETSANRPTTFKAFMATKHEERSSHFKPAKKQRLLDKRELTINVGLMEFNEEGLGSLMRGKTLPQKISKNADCKTVLAAALKKRQNLRA